MVRFWDTSAIVPLVLNEPGSQAVRTLFEHDRDIYAWWGTRIECTSAIVRAVRDQRLSGTEERFARRDQADLFATIREVAPSEDVRGRAERLLATHPLRAADALQLGAALVWSRERPVGLAFVSLDRRLREAASKEGFTVLPNLLPS